MPNCIPDYEHAHFAQYRYPPSIPAAVIFIILFALATVLHGVQMYKTKTWYLTALVLGGVSETIGYVGRLLNSLETPGCWTLSKFVIQSVLILIAPALFAASIYMILGRIILLTDGESLALIPRRWITRIFVSGDVTSLVLQAGGAGMMAIKKDNLRDIGEDILIVGLFIQLIFFGFFIIVASLYHRRLRANPTPQSEKAEIRWRHYLTTLYLTSALIFIRSVFRVIEYIMGNDGYLLRHEVFLYIFDAVLMFSVLIWMNWFHPSEIGLLLRGDKPISNGLELVTRRPLKPSELGDSDSESALELCSRRDGYTNSESHNH